MCWGSFALAVFFVYHFSGMTPDNGDMGVTLIPLSLGCHINPSDYVSTVLLKPFVVNLLPSTNHNSKNNINIVIEHNTADGYYISICQNITS